MALGYGTKIVNGGLVFNVDCYDPKSNFLVRSDSNILPDPYYWSTGTGSASGYGANGSATEQSREIRPDPFGGQTVTWRSTPDATSGADGGWNSDYYPVDTSYTYRWSTWIRRYTAGTGGTFYFGMNPAPLRNDNDALQGNPYFACPAISSLAQDQWYLVVAHCFYEGYSGDPVNHPDTGWYQLNPDGVSVTKIATKSVCNTGGDVRWNPGNTTVNHRTYHYYTTNTASGIEWAYPRLDKLDGTQPTIAEISTRGPGKLYNTVNLPTGSIKSNTGRPDFGTLGGAKSLIFDAAGEWYDSGSAMKRTLNSEASFEAWIYPAAAEVVSGDRGIIARVNTSGSGSTYFTWNKSTRKLSTYWYGTSPEGYHEPGPALNRSEWHHVVAVWDGYNHYHYIDGVQYGPIACTGAGTQGSDVEIGMEAEARQFAGGISVLRAYDVSLSQEQVLQNFNATRARYGK